MANETTHEWIETRYGKVSFKARRIVVATVPVHGGVAIGTGFTQDEALENLKRDLTVPDAAEVNTR